MSSFVKQPEVRQENFDWGVIGWRLTPDSGSKHLVIMDVTLEPGEGHNFHRHPGQEEMIIVKQGTITQFIEQEFTGVRSDARGRGLGKWLKAAMLLHVHDVYPDLLTVVTGNASSNGPMLAINTKMGFKEHRQGNEYQITREKLALATTPNAPATF